MIEIKVLPPLFTKEYLDFLDEMYSSGLQGIAFMHEITVEEAREKWPQADLSEEKI